MSSKTFIASDDSLSCAIAFVEEELENAGCPLKTIMQITVCVEEMFVNVAHYAYESSTGDVTLSVSDTDGTVSITLEDSGIPFDPLAKADPDISLSAEERDIGGLGIFMVKKTMDDVSYKRENEKNIFTMRKKIR